MSTPRHVVALAAAGATIATTLGILTNPTLGAGARESIPPEVLEDLLLRLQSAGNLVEAALAEYEASLTAGQN